MTIEGIARRIAREEIRIIMTTHGSPSLRSLRHAYVFADGKRFTLDELIIRRMRRHGSRLRMIARWHLRGRGSLDVLCAAMPPGAAP